MREWIETICNRVRSADDWTSELHGEGAEAAHAVAEGGYCQDDFVADLIGGLIDEVKQLQTALRRACTPPWPSWYDPGDAVSVDTLVEFFLRHARELDRLVSKELVPPQVLILG